MEAILRHVCRLTRSEITAAETDDNNPYGSLLELNEINFNFSVKVVVSNWVIRQTTHDSSDTELVGRRLYRHVDNYLLGMSRQQLFYRFEEARKSMEEKLSGLRVCPDIRRNLVQCACDQALKCLQSNIPTEENNDQQSVLNLDFDLFLLVDRYTFDQSFQMVPAAESSIEELKRAAAADYVGRNMSCSICFEELISGGGDDGCGEEEEEEGLLLIMPCSHVFHGDCIKKWLSVSHYCPLCRLEMPTTTN